MEKLIEYFSEIMQEAQISEFELDSTQRDFYEIQRLGEKIQKQYCRLTHSVILLSFNRLLYGYDKADEHKIVLEILQKENDKIAFIKSYTNALKNAFIYMDDFVNFSAFDTMCLIDIDATNSTENPQGSMFPLVLKAYQLSNGDTAQLSQAFKALEIISMRYRIAYSQGWRGATYLNPIRNATSIDSMINELKKIVDKDFNDEKIKAKLDSKSICWNESGGYTYTYMGILHIFARYENALKAPTDKGYFSLKQINAQIEHIAPQTPKDGKKVELCDNIGNLCLIDSTTNQIIGNKPFTDKLTYYTNLYQQREIINFAKNGKWDDDAIKARGAHLIDFVLKAWSF